MPAGYRAPTATLTACAPLHALHQVPRRRLGTRSCRVLQASAGAILTLLTGTFPGSFPRAHGHARNTRRTAYCATHQLPHGPVSLHDYYHTVTMSSSMGGAMNINVARLRRDARAAAATITSTGCFNEHVFPSPATAAADKLVYTTAASVAGVEHPVTTELTTYLGVLLRSCRDGPPRVPTADAAASTAPRTAPHMAARGNTELVVALDVSGSMTDFLGEPRTEADLLGGMPSKLEVAQSVLRAVVSQGLQPGDAFGLVTFAEDASVVLPMARVLAPGATDASGLPRLDQEAAVRAIDGVRAGGGTSLLAGMEAALALFSHGAEADATKAATTPAADTTTSAGDAVGTAGAGGAGAGGGVAVSAAGALAPTRTAYVERRIIVITDMRDSDEDAAGVAKLAGVVAEAARSRGLHGGAGVHTSFVGVGADFEAAVAEHAARRRRFRFRQTKKTHARPARGQGVAVAF